MKNLLKPKIFKQQKIVSKDKTIRVIEKGKYFNFSFDRNYIISNRNALNYSGYHSHKKLYQIIFCLSGNAKITLNHPSGKQYVYSLDNSEDAILIPPGWWRVIELSKNTVLSVLASDKYNEKDYERDFNKFKEVTESKIEFNDLKQINSSIQDRLSEGLKRSIEKNELILGDSVHTFEKKFAKFCGVKFAISCGNGFDAIVLILKALNIGKGDEVIVPSNSFIASALAVENVGAKTIFVDCNNNDFQINTSDLCQKVTKRTKAIMIVHLYGIPSYNKKIFTMCQKKKIFVIEDSSQAHGAQINSKNIGSLGIASAFSFYPTKNLGALGDGGCITTNDEKVKKKIQNLRNYGRIGNTSVFEFSGINSRLDSIQAEFLTEKLRVLKQQNKKRNLIAKTYFEQLKGLKEIILPKVKKNTQAVWYVFPVRVLNERDKIRKYLKSKGIITNIHYEIPIHKTNIYKSKKKLENCERNARQLLSLPMHPNLKKKQIRYISKMIKGFFYSKSKGFIR